MLKKSNRDVALKELGFEMCTMSLRFGNDETVEFDCPLPQSDCIGDLIYRLSYMFEKTDGEEKDFYKYLIEMTNFHLCFPPEDMLRKRNFSLKKMTESPTFKKMFNLPDLKSRTELGKMLHVAGRSPEISTELFRKAAFVEPELRIPLTRRSYLEFKDAILKEMEDMHALLDHLFWEQFERMGDRTKAKVREEEPDKFEELLRVFDISKKQACKVIMKRSQEHEREIESKYGSIVNEARRLYKVHEPASLKSVKLLEKSFDKAGFNRLVGSLIKIWEEDYGKQDEMLAAFHRAKRTNDIVGKWCVLTWIMQNLVNQTNCFKLMQLEAEDTYHVILNYRFREEVYRKIRGYLTLPERRAFQLLYFRRIAFWGRIPILAPIIMNFVTGMDEETIGLIVLVLVLKRRSWNGHRLDKELENRWRCYLKFYPLWVDILQSDERGKYAADTFSKKNISIETAIAKGKEGKTIFLKDRLGKQAALRENPLDENRIVSKDRYYPPLLTNNPLQVLVTGSKEELLSSLPKWLKAYCTKEQGQILRLKFLRGRKVTDEEIGRKLRITQQAVNKHLQAGLKNIQKGLVEEGIFE